MKFLNRIDGSDQLKTDPLNRLVTDEQIERWEAGAEETTIVREESFYIVKPEVGGGKFTYESRSGLKTGNLIEGRQEFILESGEYSIGSNFLEVTIDDSIRRTATSGGIIESGNNKFQLSTPWGAGTKITARYFQAISIDGLSQSGPGASYMAGSNIQIIDDTISATDTITTINGKTGAISKADIVALGIPAFDTNTTYTAGNNVTINGSNVISATNTTYGVATVSANGLMAATDKAKLSGIEDGANNYSLPSTLPYSMLTGTPTIPAAYSHPATHPATMITGLSTVATTGKYTDLINLPVIPTNTNELVNGAGFITSYIDTKYTAGANIAINGTNVISATNTTYSNATTGTSGLMSNTDKAKLDGITVGANNYSHPAGDGNLHVPATGTTNNGKVLTAGPTAGSLSWTTPSGGSSPNLTLTELTLGNYKIKFNATNNTLDFEVI